MTPGNDSSIIASPAQDWSLRRRVDVPDPVPGYLDRPALVERLAAAGHHIALLRAPGGFGKTTLLAAYCRRLGERGLAAAWLRVDVSDTRSSIETWLALALRHAGVDVPEPGSDPWSAAEDRVELLLSAIAARAEPCILALDNLERLADPGSVEALNTLLRGAPPDLRVTMACRELPFALDIAEPLLEGRAVVLSAAELRFSPQETTAFLGSRRSGKGLSALDRQFAGWPIALALQRDSGGENASGQADSSGLLGNWIESRLWKHLSAGQRDFLLDAGLLEPLDPVLLDEVLERNDSRHRLQALPQLDGLILPRPDGDPDSSPGTAVLHPLLRRHCAQRRIRETPERFQEIHHRAALALERRGKTVAAMRHAAEAGDPELLGRLIESAQGLRLWAQLVQPPLGEVVALLTHDVLKRWPRVALIYSHVLALSDRLTEARRCYELAAASSDGFTRNPTGDVRDIRISQFFTQMAFFVAGGTPVNSAELQSLVPGAIAITRDSEVEPDTLALLHFALCIYESRRGRFDAAFERAEHVRRFISDGQSPIISLNIDIQLGNMAMAQGQVQEAERYYASSLRSAHAHCPDELMYGIIGEALLRELQYERNRLTLALAAGMNLRDNFTRPGNTLATYTSESVIIAEVTQYAAGVDEALAILAEMTEHARLTKRQPLVRYLAALRVAMLCGDGRVAEAERAWRAEALPSSDDGCLDMQMMDWREMEMIACARLRLYIACGAYEAGREFADLLLHAAGARRLVRTAMRVRAMAMALERQAGDMDAACAHLETFLQLYAATDYARPILREGDSSREVLERLLAAHPDSPFQAAATGLLLMISRDQRKDMISSFSERELALLKLLPDLRDKQIAAELSISREGVRYHLRRIFAKLGTHNRRDTVRQARAIGLLQQ